ncbi:MAG: bacillithiol biosynthesis cysteine-adding enzyme BshC [Bacteroidia bacterium]
MAEKREIKADYLAGAEELNGFSAWPWPVRDFEPVIRARLEKAVPRELLVSELRAQNQHLPDSAAVLANINLLAEENTLTVTTGHQVCLLGGPMFTIYKIASTVALAQELSGRYPAYQFVPVLWMATEDHDWEEVNHFYPAFGEKVTYPGTFVGPVGRHVLEESIAGILPAGLPEAIREAYTPGNTIAEAFRSLMHHLFGHSGLVILDADRPSLKRVFSPALRRELLREGMGGPARETTQKLEELGYKAQIFPREINLFYLGEGGRSLIDFRDGRFVLKDSPKSWDEAGFLAELEAHPEHFSPNVALRPAYQESLLPNAAFVGGWAEVSYWLQLKAGFDALEVPFPVLVPRLHATLLTNSQAEEAHALGLMPQELAQPLHVLNDLYLAQSWDDSPLSEAIAGVIAAFDQLAAEVASIDPTLATGIRADQARAANSIESLPKKVKKALRNRNPQPYLRISALKNAVEPENTQQQRVLNFSAFLPMAPQALTRIVLEHCQPLSTESQWIKLP